jgi:hypothetical protein
MILSFNWTTAAYQAGDKTCTRRQWSQRHMEMWQRAWDQDKHIHDAWDKSPRCKGKKIGQFRLTCRPYWERLADMPEQDLSAEGGLWSGVDEFIELFGGNPDRDVAVVRFVPIFENDRKAAAND